MTQWTLYRTQVKEDGSMLWKCIAVCRTCGKQYTIKQRGYKGCDECCDERLRHDIYLYDVDVAVELGRDTIGYIDGEIEYNNNRDKLDGGIFAEHN